MKSKNPVPFVYGRIVSGVAFVNRQAELKRLTTNLGSGINTILISPRRWGKSSLVMKATEALLTNDEKIRICKLDLFNIRTEKQFYETFVREVLRSTSGKWEEWITQGKNFLKSVTPKFSVGVDPIHDFNVSLDLHPTQKSIEEILMLPEKIATSKKIKIVVCIDEFQNLSHYESPLEFQKQLRAAWQTQKHVAYCLFGSKRHMITDLFENKSMPFYKFGDLMFLERISTTHWVDYIIHAFKKTGKIIHAEAAEKIVTTVQNHPYFVQQLAQKVWIITDKAADAEAVSTALDTLLHESSILYSREVENLSNTQINFLHAVCDRVTQLSSTDTIAAYNLGTSANVQKIKLALEQREILDLLGAYPEFIDPIFECWLKEIYFK